MSKSKKNTEGVPYSLPQISVNLLGGPLLRGGGLYSQHGGICDEESEEQSQISYSKLGLIVLENELQSREWLYQH